MVYPFNEILLSNKRNEVLICPITWGNLEETMSSERNNHKSSLNYCIYLKCAEQANLCRQKAEQQPTGLGDGECRHGSGVTAKWKGLSSGSEENL